MSQNLPNGAGICYQRNDNGLFEFDPMVSDVNWSYESIRWLSYMESRPPFSTESQKFYIQHALRGGEKMVKIGGRKYFVDGFAEINGTKYFLEYDGCRWHQHNCINSLRSQVRQKCDKQRNKDLSSAGILLQTFECDWLKLKPNVVITNTVSHFFARKDVTESEILNAVVNDRFYGLLRIDIRSPQMVIDHFLQLNHPPIYVHKSLEKEQIGTCMQSLLDQRGSKFPLEKQLTLVFNQDQYLLTTDLAKFYLEKGLELSNLTLAIEYTRSKPLAKFVDTVTEKRKQATRLGDSNLQNTWKLISNSSYGRLTLNLLKRRTHKFLLTKDAPTIDDNPFLTNIIPVEGEYATDFVEVTQRKRRTIDGVPGK